MIDYKEKYFRLKKALDNIIQEQIKKADESGEYAEKLMEERYKNKE